MRQLYLLFICTITFLVPAMLSNGQVVIPPSGSYRSFYSQCNTAEGNNPIHYTLPDVTLYVNSSGKGPPIVFPEYNKSGDQQVGYLNKTPKGQVWEVYSLKGYPTDARAGYEAVDYPRTLTYLPRDSDVGATIYVYPMLVGNIQNRNDDGEYPHPPDPIGKSSIFVEKPEYINQLNIANVCQTDPVITLTDYFEGASINVNFYLDDTHHSTTPITQIDPSVVAPGRHTVTAYKHYDNGDYTETIPVNIVAATPITFSPYNSNQCINAGIINILALPTGGTWTGTAIDNNGNFNTASAGIGTFILTYTYINPNKAQNPNGCASTKVATVSVIPLLKVSAGTPFTLCINNGPKQLTGIPAGGIWSGPGVTGNSFNPQLAGAGLSELAYTYTDPVTGCSNTDSLAATVNPLAVLDIGNDTTICNNSGPISLTATPAGGTWSGPGINGNTFVVSATSQRTDTIIYRYTDPNGCTAVASRTITVVKSIPISAGNAVSLCVNSNPYDLTQDESIKGGYWSGTGVSGGFFDPAKSGAGVFSITYSYANQGGCISTASKRMEVIGIPGKVSITGTLTGCNGTVLQLFAQSDSATDYAWYHLNDNLPFAHGQQLNYTINKTEQLYCVGLNPLSCGLPKLSATFIQITSLSPTASLLASQTNISFGGLINFTASNVYNAKNYQWNFGDGGISTEQNPSHYYYAQGSFNVSLILTSPDNCTDTLLLSNSITVGKDDTTSLTPPTPRNQGYDNSRYVTKIYPSPFSDHINLIFHLTHDQSVALRIYDTFGRLIRIQTLTCISGDNKFTLDNLGGLIVKNYYLVMLKSDELNELIKILKM